MRKSKKTWSKPELTVLIRHKPEEAVLTACKSTGAGPFFSNNACLNGFGIGCPNTCNAVSAS